MSRFTYRDAADLRWYFAGGYALELVGPSSFEVMVDVLSRGCVELGNVGVSHVPATLRLRGDRRNQEHPLDREKRLRDKLALIDQRDPLSYEVLRAAYGLAPLAAANPLQKKWGSRAAILLVAPTAEQAYARSDTHQPFLEWIVRLSSDLTQAPLISALTSEIDSLHRRAVATWEAT